MYKFEAVLETKTKKTMVDLQYTSVNTELLGHFRGVWFTFMVKLG